MEDDNRIKQGEVGRLDVHSIRNKLSFGCMLAEILDSHNKLDS
jgi:hypothetical protein